MELTLGTRHWHNTVTMLHAVHLSHVHIILNFVQNSSLIFLGSPRNRLVVSLHSSRVSPVRLRAVIPRDVNASWWWCWCNMLGPSPASHNYHN